MKIPGYRSKKGWKMALATFGYGFILLVIIIAIIDPSTEETATPVTAEAEVELSDEELAQQIVVDNLGEESVESVAVNDYADNPDKKVILLTAVASDNLSSNMIKTGIYISTLELVEELNEAFDVQEIAFRWQFPLVDKYGNEELGEIMRINLYGETIEKINFENFLHGNLPDKYFEHPSFNN
jgi:hypothetical protein